MRRSLALLRTNKRNPSKYVAEGRLMVHFLKRGRKMLNAGGRDEDVTMGHNTRQNGRDRQFFDPFGIAGHAMDFMAVAEI